MFSQLAPWMAKLRNHVMKRQIIATIRVIRDSAVFRYKDFRHAVGLSIYLSYLAKRTAFLTLAKEGQNVVNFVLLLHARAPAIFCTSDDSRSKGKFEIVCSSRCFWRPHGVAVHASYYRARTTFVRGWGTLQTEVLFLAAWWCCRSLHIIKSFACILLRHMGFWWT